ncbi:pupal cuticle protein 27-like [Adelges cooleyi]|uniref:pupal cuticle protein 27-like n=1 Tax=Adelges cooleyi TaxID=133065 RepID=UPI00218057F2|nr:pupal cuticle protein 27-like [Adelges cooleyi]
MISESRYLSIDGQFGTAYKQTNGVEFKEESDAEGNRRGSYSYVDSNGQRRTVDYTAGKGGFKAMGDHLPVAPTPIPVASAVPLAPKALWAQPVAPNQKKLEPASKYDDGQWNSLFRACCQV